MSTVPHTEVDALRAQAVALAGRPGDLVQRASVYHHLYRHSGGNHAFPLLAAHGALWAGGYFRRALAQGAFATRALSLVGADGAGRMALLDTLAHAFRDINRRVCVETWFLYHLSAREHLRDEAERLIPPALAASLARCHAARRAGRRLTPDEHRALFTAFFRWEQAEIVGAAVASAFAACAWPLALRRARRPSIAFAYMTAAMPFRDFADTDERIDKGLAAYAAGERAGWARVEASLSDYGILPPAFAADPGGHFRSLLHGLFPTAPACPAS